VYLFSSNVAGQFAFLLGVVRLARIFGPELFGLFNLSQAWLSYFFRFGEMGLEVVGIRAVARDPDRMSGTVSNVVGLRLMLAVALFGAVLACASLGAFPKGSEQLIVIFSLSLFPMAVILEWVFESQQSVIVVSIARVLKGVVFLALTYFLVASPAQINGSAYYYVLSLAISSLLVFLVARARVRLAVSRFHWKEAKGMFVEALPIGLVTLCSQYSLFIGTFLLGYIVADKELGFYTASHRLVIFMWAYGITTSTRVILPQLSILHKQSEAQFGDFIAKYFKMIAICACIIGLVALLGGDEIIRVCYGAAYQESAPIFRILSCALVIAVMRSILETGLIASHRQRQLMWGTIGLAGAYTVFTVAFSAWWGVKGTAFAAVLSEAMFGSRRRSASAR
jgi:O-antigen/teichoic acid export membrane protein